MGRVSLRQLLRMVDPLLWIFFACVVLGVKHNAYAVDSHVGAYAEYVCPYPGDVEDVLEQQVGLDEDTYEYSRVSFFKWTNDGDGVSTVPIWAKGDGSEFKIKMVDWDTTYSMCLEDTKNVQEERSHDESTIRVCYRRGHEECETIKNGDCATVLGLNWCPYEVGDQLCVQPQLLGSDIDVSKETCVDLGKTKWHGAMCKEAKDNLDKTGELDNCVCYPQWVSPACYGSWFDGIPGMSQYKDQIDGKTALGKFILGKYQFSAPLVQCVQDSVRSLFFKGQKGCKRAQVYGITMFEQLKDALRESVLAALVIYVIFFAMKNLTEGGSQGQLFIFIVRMALVIWFAIGNGIETFYDTFIMIGMHLAGIAMSAGGKLNSNICNFTDAIAPGGQYSFIKDKVIQDYSFWIELDCKVFNYFGGNFLASLLKHGTITSIFYSLTIVVMMDIVVGLILLIFLILMIVLLITIVLRFIHLYIGVVIAASFLIFFAPIFVPFALFKPTQGYFTNWMSQIVSYSLIPLMLFVYIAMLLNAYDRVIYGNIDDYPNMFNKDGTINVDKDPDDESKYMCDDRAVGCLSAVIFQDLQDDMEAGSDSGLDIPFVGDLLGSITITGFPGALLSFALMFEPKHPLYGKLLHAVVTGALVIILFYILLGIVIGAIAEATGNAGLTALAKGAIDLVKLIVDVAKAVMNKSMSQLSSAGGGGKADTGTAKKLMGEVMKQAGAGEVSAELEQSMNLESYAGGGTLMGLAKDIAPDQMQMDGEGDLTEGGQTDAEKEEGQDESSTQSDGASSVLGTIMSLLESKEEKNEDSEKK